MNFLFNLQRVKTSEIIKSIEVVVGKLSYSQKNDLSVRLDEFEHYETKDRNVPNILWRLSGLFCFLLCFLLIVLYFPIKWIVTGNWGFNSRSNMGKLIHSWGKKIYR